jgi:hypothetical protein
MLKFNRRGCIVNNKRIFVFNHETARRNAEAQCKLAPAGCIVTFDLEPIKTTLQERKYHAMINDIAESCVFMNQTWSAEDWKRLLIAAFVDVMRDVAKSKGESDPFEDQGRVVPALTGKGIVQLGVQSRRFKKVIASEFIEYLYAWGTVNNAVWNEAKDFDERFTNKAEA